MKRQVNSIIKPNFLIVIMILIVASLPLIGFHVWQGHDIFFHIQRILSIENALENGQFPVRIYKEIFAGGGYGYGYGCPLFYPELFLYFPAILCLLGLPVVISYNVFLIVINAVTLYLALYSFSSITKSKHIGMLAAVLYELSVYRFVDMYTRASLGEVLALMFCPLILCGLTFLKRGEHKKWWILALGMSGVLQSHILSFVMMVMLCVIFVLCNIKVFFDVQKIFSIFKAVLLTTGLNLWFIIPFLSVSSMDVIATVGKDNFWDTTADIIQLFDISLYGTSGYETFGESIADSLPKTPGLPLILGSCIFLICVAHGRTEGSMIKIQGQTYGYLVVGIVSTIMLTSLFPWRIIKSIGFLKDFFEKFQFIYRFNVIAILFLSIVAAYGYYLFFSKYFCKRDVLILISLMLCVYSLVYMSNFAKTSIKYYENDVIEKTYMDDLYLVENNDIYAVTEPECSVTEMTYNNYVRKDSEVSFDFSFTENIINQEKYIDIPITYYPVYQVLADGENKLEYECSPDGVIRIIIPEGVLDGHITVKSTENVLFLISDIISLITVLGMGCMFIRNYFIRKSLSGNRE